MEICIDEITEIDNHNSIFEKDFNFQKTIANGSFGIVKLAINKLTGDNVAVKIIEKNQTTLQALTKTKFLNSALAKKDPGNTCCPGSSLTS